LTPNDDWLLDLSPTGAVIDLPGFGALKGGTWIYSQREGGNSKKAHTSSIIQKSPCDDNDDGNGTSIKFSISGDSSMQSCPTTCLSQAHERLCDGRFAIDIGSVMVEY